jgi:hypothetical protein
MTVSSNSLMEQRGFGRSSPLGYFAHRRPFEILPGPALTAISPAWTSTIKILCRAAGVTGTLTPTSTQPIQRIKGPNGTGSSNPLCSSNESLRTHRGPCRATGEADKNLGESTPKDDRPVQTVVYTFGVGSICLAASRAEILLALTAKLKRRRRWCAVPRGRGTDVSCAH